MADEASNLNSWLQNIYLRTKLQTPRDMSLMYIQVIVIKDNCIDVIVASIYRFLTKINKVVTVCSQNEPFWW